MRGRCTAALAAPLLLSVVGCGPDDRPDGQTSSTCGVGSARPECYDSGDISLYCYVEATRQVWRGMDPATRSLPPFAVTEERQGAPLFWNVQAEQETAAGQVMDRFDTWRSRNDFPPNEDGAVADCRENADHDSVVTLFGEPAGA